jgi:hypothetical protein
MLGSLARPGINHRPVNAGTSLRNPLLQRLLPGGVLGLLLFEFPPGHPHRLEIGGLLRCGGLSSDGRDLNLSLLLAIHQLRPLGCMRTHGRQIGLTLLGNAGVDGRAFNNPHILQFSGQRRFRVLTQFNIAKKRCAGGLEMRLNGLTISIQTARDARIPNSNLDERLGKTISTHYSPPDKTRSAYSIPSAKRC